MVLETIEVPKVSQNDYTTYKKRVEGLIKARKNTQAITLLKQMQQAYPSDPWSFRQHAFIALKHQKKFAEAAQVAEAGLETNPNSISLKRLLAESLSRLRGEERRAEKLFEELISSTQGKEKTKLLSIYGDFLLRRGRSNQAQQIYLSILQDTPDDARIQIDLARSYRMNEQYQKCLQVLDENTRLEDPFWLREKAQCLIEMGKGIQAMPLLTQAREIVSNKFFRYQKQKEGFLRRLEPLEKAAQALNGQWQEAISWAIKQPRKGQISTVWRAIRHKLTSDNEVKKGIDYLTQILTDDPTNLIIPHQIDQLIFHGNLSSETCSEIIERLLQIGPQNIEILAIAARAHQDTDPQFAAELWSKAWEVSQTASPQSNLPTAITWVTVGYSQFLRKQNRYDEAYGVVEQARTQWGIDSWDLDLERAINLARLGSYNEAYKILKQLNRARADHQIVLDQMGVCLRAIGELDEALKIYQHKVESYPDDLFGWQGLGKTLFELGRHDEALETFEKLLQKNPDDVDARWFIGEILQYKGEYDKAQSYLKEIDLWALIERGWSPLFYEHKLAELERQRLEQQAELAEAKKLSYLGIMATATAHELNQPVGIIRAATSAALNDLRDGYFQPEDMKPVLERILTQTERLGAIIDNFRAFARGERSHREKVNLNHLVEQTTAYFVEQFKHRNITLITRLRSKHPLPIAWANPFQLEEVLINLLTNARDAVEGKRNATVWVKTWRRRGGGSGFSIEDNGPGLAPEYRQQMFVPFASTKSTEKGTGLGLYISRRIVDDLGGHLRYQDRLGGGACFSVNLPPLKG